MAEPRRGKQTARRRQNTWAASRLLLPYALQAMVVTAPPVSTDLSTGRAETGPLWTATRDNDGRQNVAAVQELCEIQAGRLRCVIMAHIGDVLPRSCRCALANVTLRVDLLRSPQLRSELKAQQRRWAHQEDGEEGRGPPRRCTVLTPNSSAARHGLSHRGKSG